jgi:hypothetical protein
MAASIPRGRDGHLGAGAWAAAVPNQRAQASASELEHHLHVIGLALVRLLPVPEADPT